MIRINETFSRFKAWLVKINKPTASNNWYEELISLYFVRTNDGICLYSHYFKLGSLSHIENQMIGMGFSALHKMLKEIVGIEASLRTIDLGNRKVLIETRNNLMSILIVSKDLATIRDKLHKLTIIFEQMFELQRQIHTLGYVCQEDYAFTSQLISLVFSNRFHNILDLIPLLFDLITYNRPKHDNTDEKNTNNSDGKPTKSLTTSH